MREVNNDRIFPPRAMTRHGVGGHAAETRRDAPFPLPSMQYYVENLPLIRLCLQLLRAIARTHCDIFAPLNFSKRPLVKLKATLYSLFCLRTTCSTSCLDFRLSLMDALVRLFVVAKCIVCERGAKWVFGGRGRGRGAGQARLLLLMYVGGLSRYSEGRPDNDLHIGGIFPMEGEGGWQGGQACMPAAELALADVNARSDLLSGFKLLLHSNDSKVYLDTICTVSILN